MSAPNIAILEKDGVTSLALHPGVSQRYKKMAAASIEHGNKEIDSNSQNIDSSIPGADLNGRAPSDLSKAELIRWLKCRHGASLLGKKTDLVERYGIVYLFTFIFGKI